MLTSLLLFATAVCKEIAVCGRRCISSCTCVQTLALSCTCVKILALSCTCVQILALSLSERGSICWQFMGQIKEKQTERDRGDWARLSEAQRHQEEANLQQISRLAQYHNVMGSATISTLKMITGEIQSIFCHPTFVDRIASMLNYFLCRLVSCTDAMESAELSSFFSVLLSWFIMFSFWVWIVPILPHLLF